MSHLASANLKSSSFTQKQTEKFLNISKGFALSLSNSSALLNGDHLNQEWSRVGLALFGVSPVENHMALEYGLKPVMTMKTNVISFAFIDGRQISLESHHTELYERYKVKFEQQKK